MATHIFYHRSDLDGKCSGAIAYQHEIALGNEPILHPINYGDDFPWDDITSADSVYMLDFCLQPYEDMKRLHDLLGDALIWCDHHKTALKGVREAMDVLPGQCIPIIGTRSAKLAGCELTWEFCYPNGTIPLAVYLLGRYDVWDHDADARILPFQYGSRLLELHPDDPNWTDLLSRSPLAAESILRNGRAVLRYVEQDRRRIVKGGAFLHPILEHTALCCNAGGGSQLFDDAHKGLLEAADLLLTFGFNGYKRDWVFGLYHKPGREDIDCGQIAAQFGGGGHPGAAGFRTEQLYNILGELA